MKSRAPEPAHIHLNLTAMLDVVFNLIFFFISICNMAGNELPKLTVPSPDASQARLIDARKKVTVNVVPDGTSGMARAVKIGADAVPEPQLRELAAWGEAHSAVSCTLRERPQVAVEIAVV